MNPKYTPTPAELELLQINQKLARNGLNERKRSEQFERRQVLKKPKMEPPPPNMKIIEMIHEVEATLRSDTNKYDKANLGLISHAKQAEACWS
jgi:hypothetical protein